MKTLISALAMLALVAVFTVPVSAQMGPMPSNPPGGMRGNGPAGREHHPEIRHAMHALENAKNDLEHAAHDYEGHRTKAIQHIDEAMSELQQALAVDKH